MTIQFRRGTAAQWAAANPVLAAGQPGFETDSKRFKLGDGTAAWNDLPYANSGGSVPTIFGTAIKYDADRVVVTPYQQSGPLTFTRDPAGSIVGGGTDFAVTANGAAVDLTALGTLVGTQTFDTSSGRLNIVSAFRDQGGYSYGVRLGATTVLPPGAPTLAAGTSTSTSQALTITPSSTGGTAASYTILYKRAVDSAYSTGPSGSTLTPVVTGLPSSTAYNFKTIATNAGGSSPDSNIVNASTSTAVVPRLAAALITPASPIDLSADGGIEWLYYGNGNSGLRYKPGPNQVNIAIESGGNCSTNGADADMFFTWAPSEANDTTTTPPVHEMRAATGTGAGTFWWEISMDAVAAARTADIYWYTNSSAPDQSVQLTLDDSSATLAPLTDTKGDGRHGVRATFIAAGATRLKCRITVPGGAGTNLFFGGVAVRAGSN